MKFIKSFIDLYMRKDTSSSEKLEQNKVKATIEGLCDNYLSDSNDVLVFEALPSAIEDVISIFTTQSLSERYEYTQIEETLFAIKLRELDI